MRRDHRATSQVEMAGSRNLNTAHRARRHGIDSYYITEAIALRTIVAQALFLGRSLSFQAKSLLIRRKSQRPLRSTIHSIETGDSLASRWPEAERTDQFINILGKLWTCGGEFNRTTPIDRAICIE